jgi:mono/diheme cytochrome c family protein
LDPNAVPVGFLREDNHLYAGLVDGEPAETLPFELTQDVLDEGQRQYQAFCAPCHGIAGYGDGVISLEGFPRPASYHTAELRAQPVGHFFQVITNGVGNMYSYASRISPENRWAIAAYIRALQISQEADFATLPDEVQAQFESLN